MTRLKTTHFTSLLLPFFSHSTSAQWTLESSPVQSDLTIRPFNSDNFCVYKRWADYIKSQDLWIWNCNDASHANPAKSGKYHWAYDPATKLIKSWSPTTINHATLKSFCKDFRLLYHLRYTVVIYGSISSWKNPILYNWNHVINSIDLTTYCSKTPFLWKDVPILMLVRQLLLCWY